MSLLKTVGHGISTLCSDRMPLHYKAFRDLILTNMGFCTEYEILT
jgi:hypothetical protein